MVRSQNPIRVLARLTSDFLDMSESAKFCYRCVYQENLIATGYPFYFAWHVVRLWRDNVDYLVDRFPICIGRFPLQLIIYRE